MSNEETPSPETVPSPVADRPGAFTRPIARVVIPCLVLMLVSWIAAFVALISLCLTGQTKKHEYSSREKAFYADPALVDFVRPGLVIKINSAAISSTGAIRRRGVTL